ncbi:60S ribosomal protein L37 [Exophiala xenobiotica]|uniref:60S ribosomal protein L37 n=1 Tax=Lithohypha guttulata TaxID=1690604 RepID=A0ABR0KPL9_9EURO|nr:60S ribosomal protein L37 [Lithohypha guttulata]KAK5330540.1 60S ribosomal protein L37 [Exophiala xenobiotica]
MLALSLAVLAGSLALTAAQPCDPSSRLRQPYEVDFRKQSSLPSDWILADYANVIFNNDMGANFSFVKRYDAPYIWSKNYLMFGRVDVEVQAAPGSGLITGCVLMSDNKDELDWEWSGNNFKSNNGVVQTNYFGKGITGNYDRGTQEAVDNPTGSFHTYSYDWNEERVEWLIDGKIIRTVKNDGKTDGDYQYPQSPSRLHLGIWNAGDPDSPEGVRNWAGGLLDMNQTYSAYIRSVKITPYKPCSSYQFPENFSGKWSDVKCTNQTVTNETISSGDTYSGVNETSGADTTAPTNNNSGSKSYTIVAGDDCNKISQAQGCSVDELKATNPSINCNMLVVGQNLNIPQQGGSSSSSSAAPSGSSSSSASASGSASQVTTTVTNTVTVTAQVASGSTSPRLPSRLPLPDLDLEGLQPSPSRLHVALLHPPLLQFLAPQYLLSQTLKAPQCPRAPLRWQLIRLPQLSLPQ